MHDQPGVGTGSLPMLLAPGVDLAGDALPVLLKELRDLPQAMLVLDDYHALENAEVHRIREFLLEHGPPTLTLARSSRRGHR